MRVRLTADSFVIAPQSELGGASLAMGGDPFSPITVHRTDHAMPAWSGTTDTATLATNLKNAIHLSQTIEFKGAESAEALIGNSKLPSRKNHWTECSS